LLFVLALVGCVSVGAVSGAVAEIFGMVSADATVTEACCARAGGAAARAAAMRRNRVAVMVGILDGEEGVLSCLSS
jgi:hypothetical protein